MYNLRLYNLRMYNLRMYNLRMYNLRLYHLGCTVRVYHPRLHRRAPSVGCNTPGPGEPLFGIFGYRHSTLF